MENLKRCEPCKLTERVLQFGEGNFLRGFVDWMIDKLNKEADFDCGVVVVQPLPNGMIDTINAQDGLYTLYLRGLQAGSPVEETRIVECITRGINPYDNWNDFIACSKNPNLRFIVSNTTESGIEYIKGKMTFPARMTLLLKARYETGLRGFVFLPCELIDQNGDNLKKCILKYADEWRCEEGFINWIKNENQFTNTLVDRIVTGYPKDNASELELKYGYNDSLLDTAEIFHLWVIETENGKSLSDELPFDKHGMHVIWTDDVTPYKKRKVRILNGAHTMMVPAAYMCGLRTVGEVMKDETVFNFMNNGLHEEVIPTLDLPKPELEKFTYDVIERFNNPFIQHYLLSIALNSVSKFQVRVLPSLLAYYDANGKLPKRLIFSIAALIKFYRDGEPNDNPDIMSFMKSASVDNILSKTEYWDRDLSFMSATVKSDLDNIELLGMKKAMENLE